MMMTLGGFRLNYYSIHAIYLMPLVFRLRLYSINHAIEECLAVYNYYFHGRHQCPSPPHSPWIEVETDDAMLAQRLGFYSDSIYIIF